MIAVHCSWGCPSIWGQQQLCSWLSHVSPAVAAHLATDHGTRQYPPHIHTAAMVLCRSACEWDWGLCCLVRIKQLWCHPQFTCCFNPSHVPASGCELEIIAGLHTRYGARTYASMGCTLCVQVREIGNQVAPEPFRWTAEALLALQEVSRSSSSSSTASHVGCTQQTGPAAASSSNSTGTSSSSRFILRCNCGKWVACLCMFSRGCTTGGLWIIRGWKQHMQFAGHFPSLSSETQQGSLCKADWYAMKGIVSTFLISKCYSSLAHTYPNEFLSNNRMSTALLPCCILCFTWLQASEDFVVHLFEDCNLCAIHAKRVTISECDLEPVLAMRLVVSQHGSHVLCSLTAPTYALCRALAGASALQDYFPYASNGFSK